MQRLRQRSTPSPFSDEFHEVRDPSLLAFEIRFLQANRFRSFGAGLGNFALDSLGPQSAVTGSEPAGAATGVAWATPIELPPADDGAWRGTVVLLDETLTLYVGIRAEAEGKLFAASGILKATIDRGAKLLPQTTVYRLFPEYASFAESRSSKGEHHPRGPHHHDFQASRADENGDDYAPGNEDKMQGQTEQPDWYKFILDLPLSAAPEKEGRLLHRRREPDRRHRSQHDPRLAAGLLRLATSPARLDSFHRYHLNLTPTGEAYLGGATHIRSRDELKLGQLYLNGWRLERKARREQALGERQRRAAPDERERHRRLQLAHQLNQGRRPRLPPVRSQWKRRPAPDGHP